MGINVNIKDNSRIVVETLSGNTEAALTAMGIKGVNLVLKQMQKGYGKPIWQTGDLQRDVSYEVDKGGANGGSVTIGNTLNYASFVHEGTSRMKGRPYIKDGLTGGNSAEQLRKVAEAYLKNGFE